MYSTNVKVDIMTTTMDVIEFVREFVSQLTAIMQSRHRKKKRKVKTTL